MSFETISEEGWPDYEVWTCDACGYSICLNGVGGDVACCPECEANECYEDAVYEQERERRLMEGDGDVD